MIAANESDESPARSQKNYFRRYSADAQTYARTPLVRLSRVSSPRSPQRGERTADCPVATGQSAGHSLLVQLRKGPAKRIRITVVQDPFARSAVYGRNSREITGAQKQKSNIGRFRCCSSSLCRSRHSSSERLELVSILDFCYF